MDILKDLNPAQKEAVTHEGGPLLIVAGAGTGKTTVITKRIAWLIEKGLAKPEEILALTFTDKAAGEMEERVDRLLPLGYVDVWVSTFHSFGERILKDYGLEIGLPNDFKVLTRAEQWLIVRNNLTRFNLDYYRPLGNPTRFIHALLTHFSRAKDEEIWPEQYLNYVEGLKLDADTDLPPVILNEAKRSEESRTNVRRRKSADKLRDPSASPQDDGLLDFKRLQEVADAYHTYQQLLLENSALDFGDLINYTLKLLRERSRVLKELREKFKYILVDEFQDTNWAQYELMKLLAAPKNNITVVGDDDQSVYKFRGASISNILDFKRDYPQCKEVFLTENYRSYQGVLDTAYGFIQQNNPYRLEVKLAEGKGSALSKKLKAARGAGGMAAHETYRTAQDEAEGVVKRILELKDGVTPTTPSHPLGQGGKPSGRRGKFPPVGGETVAWSDFAILVRANSSAPIFLKELKRQGIPFQYVANKGLYFEPIIQEVLDYLRFLDNHQDSQILYRVISRAPFALPHEDIVRLSSYAHQKTISLYDALKSASAAGVSENGQSCLERLFAMTDVYVKLARAYSAAEVYVQVVRDLGLEERVAEPWGARDAQYLAAFYERIKGFEVSENDHTLHGFLSALGLELEAGEEGALPADFEEGPDTVKVITAHSAKGLEWRYVFIPHLIDRRFPSVERRDPIELPRALIKETLPEGDVHLQEERRLFYVALTRARDGVFLTRAENYFGKTVRRPSRFLIELGMAERLPEVTGGYRRLPEVAPLRGGAPPLSGVHTRAAYPIPDSFSFSSVSAFLKCPLDFKMRYLLRIPTPGSAYLSFGSTIHKTLEEFLKLWQQHQRMAQGDLFAMAGDRASGAPEARSPDIPTFDELKSIYDRVWIDDWYESAAQKREYREEKGPRILKNFYEHFAASPPQSKHLEKFFKIAMGPHKFVGKIDRVDEVEQGSVIIDYKTGQSAEKKLQKVDRDQLIIYQIAAQEFLGEQVKNLQYWYLDFNQFSEQFVAQQKHMDELKGRYAAHIEQIVDTIQRNAFEEAHEAAGQHECRYKQV